MRAPDDSELFEDVAAEDDVPEGGLLGVRVDGRAVVLARVGGEVFAVEGVCTHMSVLLEEGDLRGATLSCPRHDAAFDVRTGAVIRGPAAAPLDRHAVCRQDGRLRVCARPHPAADGPHGEGR
jgi:nitrite reductase/ring-hydroxylating ferredoxin subunit